MQKELSLALIQTPLVWESPEANRLLLGKKIDGVAQGTDLVVLPEMFSTGFTMTPSHVPYGESKITLQWMQAMAKEKNMALTGSIVFYEDAKHYNRLFFVEPNGTVSHYDKRHTFTLAGEDKVYRAGTAKLVLDYKGFKICPLICYDLRFPVWARNVENYDVLLYVANWPSPRIAAWDTLLKARAIENMSYCIGVNRVGLDDVGHEYPGHSAAYDALGRQLVFSKEETVLYVVLKKEHIRETRQKLKFLDDRDSFNLK